MKATTFTKRQNAPASNAPANNAPANDRKIQLTMGNISNNRTKKPGTSSSSNSSSSGNQNKSKYIQSESTLNSTSSIISVATIKNDSDIKSEIVINGKLYTASLIQELIERNEKLTTEIEFLNKNLSDKDFKIRTKDIEINDLRQNYDKVKSVLDQKIAKENQEEDSSKSCNLSEIRAKKQGVSGESSSESNVELKTYEKSEYSLNLIVNALKTCANDFMKMLEISQITQIANCMYEKKIKAQTYVIREGEVGEQMYVLANGKLEVTKDGKKLRDMFPGELFGELAILQNCLRTASVKAVSESSFWAVDRKVYQAILKKSNSQYYEECQKFLQSVKLLKDLPKDKISKIAGALNSESYEKNDYIIIEGEEGQTFYLIKNGEVKVEHTIDGIKKEIRTLKAGDYFGEQALLRNEIRTASVLAKSKTVDVFTLDQDDFSRLIGDLNEIKTKSYDDIEKLPDTKSKETERSEYTFIELKDLDVISVLGIGGFGTVELVRHNTEKSYTFALKSMSKQYIVQMQQQSHVFNERDILFQIKSDFICKLYRTYRDNKYVYMLMELCLGGEIWTILRNRTAFENQTVKFIMACVILALEYLHSNDIIYRDLKPENLLLDKQGYVKICDFGFAKRLGIGRKTYTFCGTPEYVAPEIIMNRGHNFAADLWSLGILMVELLTGAPPFQNNDPMSTYNQILKGFDKIKLSNKVNKQASILIKSLCKENPSERLGYGKVGINDIKNHRYLSGIIWSEIVQRKAVPPIIPKIDSNIDMKNFDKFSSDRKLPPDENSGWDQGFEM